MKVLCLKQAGQSDYIRNRLTVGKVYVMIEDYGPSIKVIDNSGEDSSWPLDCFKTFDKIRDEFLKDLLR
jgi:hypothetical protein